MPQRQGARARWTNGPSKSTPTHMPEPWLLFTVLFGAVVVLTVLVAVQAARQPPLAPSSGVFFTLSLVPTSLTVPAGYSVPVYAFAVFQGTPLTATAGASWSTNDHDVCTVDNGGLVTGVARGTTSVQASYMSVTADATCVVSDATLVSITITPASPAVARSASFQLTALGVFSDGSTVDVTNVSAWSSSNHATATVLPPSGSGLVLGVSGGSSIIQAETHGVMGTTTLFVGS
jgi:hypothetical protein